MRDAPPSSAHSREPDASAGRPAAPSRAASRVAYTFAVLRAVPHVHRDACVPVGVIVHAPTADFLAMRVVTDAAWLAARAPGVDAELLARYLSSCHAICHGDPSAGPLALLAPSERFHWITAYRSDVIQSGPVHEGLCDVPGIALEELFAEFVRGE